MARTPRTPLLQSGPTKGDTLDSTEDLTQLGPLRAKKPNHPKTLFTYKTGVQEKLQPQQQSSTERLTTAECISSKVKDTQVHNDPSVITDTRLWFSQPVVLQWGRRRKFSGFGLVCSWALSRCTETRKSRYRPLEPSCNLQVTCGAKGLPGNLLWHHPTWRGNSPQSTYLGKKGETTGHACRWLCHALLACQVWVTFDFSPGW